MALLLVGIFITLFGFGWLWYEWNIGRHIDETKILILVIGLIAILYLFLRK